MSEGRDVVCISSIDWDFIWQGHQEIMARLADRGHRVLYVENTAVRRPTLRDLPRLRQRVRNWGRGVKGFRRERANLVVYSPLILPYPYSPSARWINRTLLIRAVRSWMRAERFRRPILWIFLPTPLVLDLVQGLDPAMTVYYCIDDLTSSSREARRIAVSEETLLRRADLVFVTSEKLRLRAARFSDRVHVFPFGVNYRACEAVRTAGGEGPDDLRGLPRPVVGYVGGIHQWMDQELLADLAGRMPRASFVFVGPRQTDVSRLERCPNVHLLGARPHADALRYIKGFDVGLVPYRLTEYTAHVYPTKLNEYLAMGIPVVTTDLPEIRRFNAEHGHVVTVARTPESFAAAVRTASEDRSPPESQRRIGAARRNDWDERIARMLELIGHGRVVHRVDTARCPGTRPP